MSNTLSDKQNYISTSVIGATAAAASVGAVASMGKVASVGAIALATASVGGVVGPAAGSAAEAAAVSQRRRGKILFFYCAIRLGGRTETKPFI